MSICLDLQPDRLGQVTFAPSSSGNAGRIRTETDLVVGFIHMGPEREGVGRIHIPGNRGRTEFEVVPSCDWTAPSVSGRLDIHTGFKFAPSSTLR